MQAGQKTSEVLHGDIVLAFQHKRLHELPLTGGGSCLRESVPVHPTLLAHADKLMRAVGWHGVAMVEFKLDEATDDCPTATARLDGFQVEDMGAVLAL